MSMADIENDELQDELAEEENEKMGSNSSGIALGHPITGVAQAYIQMPSMMHNINGVGADDKNPAKRRKRGKGGQDNAEARRESHKIIEQKRRQKINDKINELRELLNYPDGSQNKAVVLQAAVEQIRYMKSVCQKMMLQQRQIQEDHLHIMQENERLRKLLAEKGITDTATEEKESAKPTLVKPIGTMTYTNTQDVLRLSVPDVFLYNIEDPSAHSHGLSFPLRGGLASHAQLMPAIALQSNYTASPFTTERDGMTAPSAQNTNAAVTGSSTASPLTSTETENGVSITRLIFPGT